MRIICIGAHPDDCEIGFGGTAAKAAALGHAVKFLSVTNGAAGHHIHSREETAARRRREAREAGRFGAKPHQVAARSTPAPGTAPGTRLGRIDASSASESGR